MHGNEINAPSSNRKNLWGKNQRGDDVTRFERLRAWARGIKRDVVAVYFAARDPRTPWLVRLLAIAVAGYALSPIDLIPDFIPVLGYLDDLILVPLGLRLVLQLLPAEVLDDARVRATETLARPRSRIAAAVIIAIWLLVLFGSALALWPHRR